MPYIFEGAILLAVVDCPYSMEGAQLVWTVRTAWRVRRAPGGC